MELVSATTDYAFEGSEFESVFGDKSLFEATASFVLSLSADYGAEQIKDVFKKWAADDMTLSNFAPLTAEQKDLARKVNELVNSKNFQGTIEGGTSVMENFVDAILSSGVKMEVQKVKKEDDDFGMRNDNTQVAPPAAPGF